MTVEEDLARNLAIIVPTRGRRQEVIRLMEAWSATKAVATLILGIDADDEETYPEGVFGPMGAELGITLQRRVLPRTNMNGTLNALAVEVAPFYRGIGFMGDDHVPRTRHWDRTVAGALIRPCAVVYGNDLFQGPNLPTAVFMDSRIVKTLGYMAPPDLIHLYLDNSWLTWGRYLDTLQYLPNVIIEHMHPQAGKADWDDGHKRVNGGDIWEHDEATWKEYSAGQLTIDVGKLVQVREA